MILMFQFVILMFIWSYWCLFHYADVYFIMLMFIWSCWCLFHLTDVYVNVFQDIDCLWKDRYTYACMHLCMYKKRGERCMYVCKYSYMYVHIFTYIHIHIHIYIHVHIHIHIHIRIHIHIHIHIHAYIHILEVLSWTTIFEECLRTCMYVRVYACIQPSTLPIHIHHNTHVNIHIHKYTYTYEQCCQEQHLAKLASLWIRISVWAR